MKVLLVNNYWYRRGGSESVLLTTKRLLEAAGHQVVCFGIDDERNTVPLDYAIPMKKSTSGEFIHGLHSIYNNTAKKLFATCLRNEQPDVIHVHNIYHHISFSICDVIKKSHIPAIFTAHDYKLISMQYRMYHHGMVDTATLNRPIMALRKNVMESWPRTLVAVVESLLRRFRRYNHVFAAYTTPSDYMRSILQKHGITATRVHTLYNPIGQEWFQTKTHSFSKQSGVLFAGRLEIEKGAQLLESIAAQLPHILFRIAGNGTYIPKARNIQYLGMLTPTQLRKEIDAARMVLVPSLWPENAPMSMVESLARGTMVIGSNIGGIPEWLPTNWQVTPAQHVSAWKERILYLYESETNAVDALRQEVELRIRAEHSESVYVHKLEKLYSSIV